MEPSPPLAPFAIKGTRGALRALRSSQGSTLDPLDRYVATRTQREVFRKYIGQDRGHKHRDADPKPRRMMYTPPVPHGTVWNGASGQLPTGSLMRKGSGCASLDSRSFRSPSLSTSCKRASLSVRPMSQTGGRDDAPVRYEAAGDAGVPANARCCPRPAQRRRR